MKKIIKKIIIFLLICSSLNVIYSQTTVTIDETFGENGITIIPTTNDAFISCLKFDSHGNIIVAGRSFVDVAIAKTNSEGIIDRNFGNNGIVRISMLQFFGENETDFFEIYDLKIREENKILIVLKNIHSFLPSSSRILLMQFNENGSIDEDFGTDGKIFIGVNGHSAINTENSNFMLFVNSAFIYKYNYSGNIDENFGENGKVYLSYNQPLEIYPNCIKTLRDNSIIIAGGDNYNNREQKLVFLKLTPDGSFATDFADNGIFSMNIENYLNKQKYFTNVIEDNEGNLIFAGKLADSLIVCSFNSNGAINNDFGENGFFYSERFFAYPANQTIIQHGDKYFIGQGDEVISINRDGTLNNYSIFANPYFLIFDMKLQETNKIIIGGGSNENLDYYDFVLARLNIDPEISLKPTEISNLQIIYPNPAKETLYFSNKTTFEIIDIQGRTLLKTRNPVKCINISNLKAGIYFIKLNNNLIEKFIKE